MKIVDLTHTFQENMPLYPGDPSPELKQVASIGIEGYTDHQITTVMHVGTHMDAPLHMIEGGKRMHEITVDMFMGEGVVIDARGKTVIDESLLVDKIIPEGAIALVYTGLGAHYRDASYFQDNPVIAESFAQRLVDLKVKIIGMDMLSPDQPPYTTHKVLLGNEVLIIENLTNLDQLMNVEHFEVIALPMNIKADAAPVRIIARY